MSFEESPFDLGGQIAIVTGASRGIGRGIAISLAQAGAAVSLVGRDETALEETARFLPSGNRSIQIKADVSDNGDVERMVSETERTLGPVTILVNNAGILGTVGPFWQLDADEWRRVVDIGLVGPYLCSRAVLPRMIERKQGRIINVSSSGGLGPVPYGSSYCTAKAALIRLTEYIPIEAGQYGIAGFVINPGWVRTNMSDYLRYSDAARTYLPWINEGVEAGKVAYTATEKVGQLVVRLASGQADALSGRFIDIDDNLDTLIQQAESIVAQDARVLRLKQVTAPDAQQTPS